MERRFLVVVIDVATMDKGRRIAPLFAEHIVTARSSEEAERKAVAEDNTANNYGPAEDGGFLAVATYTSDELKTLLAQMEKQDPANA